MSTDNKEKMDSTGQCNSVFERYVRMASRDQERAAKVVAKSFYKILRKNGFTHNQVISVAGYILDGLIEENNSSAEPEKAPGRITDNLSL